MKTITITNSYSYSNKGDAAILLGTITYLKELFGENNLNINILSLTPETDRKIYLKERCVKNVESNILNPHPYKHTKFGKFIAVLKLFFRSIYILLFRKFLLKKEVSMQLISESDLVIVCGGGFLGGKKLNSIIHLMQIYFNVKLGKKVITMGISIEPMKKGILKLLTEKILKKLNYIVAREIITYDYLKTFIAENKIFLVPDMAFMIDNNHKKNIKLDKFKNSYDVVVGITVRDCFFNKKNRRDMMDNYINVLKEFIVKYSKKMNIGFVFIPQVIVSHASDVDMAKKIKKILPIDVKQSFLILDNNFSPLELKSLIGRMDYFVGTRMHSNIFALSMNVPTIAIAYEKKTNGIMKMVGLEDYIVEIENIDFKVLCNKFNKLLKDSDVIRHQLNINILNLKNDIRSILKDIVLEE